MPQDRVLAAIIRVTFDAARQLYEQSDADVFRPVDLDDARCREPRASRRLSAEPMQSAPCPRVEEIVWSSLTKVKPRSRMRSARSDLPDPEGPVMSTARPPLATVVA